MKQALALLLSVLVICGSIQAQERKVANRKYWTAVGTAAGVGLADAIQSKQWRSNHPESFEANPVLGQHPGWPQVLGIGVAFHGGAAFVSYEMKKHGWRLWWLPQLALIGAHAYGIATSHQRVCQRTNPTFPNFCH